MRVPIEPAAARILAFLVGGIQQSKSGRSFVSDLKRSLEFPEMLPGSTGRRSEADKVHEEPKSRRSVEEERVSKLSSFLIEHQSDGVSIFGL